MSCAHSAQRTVLRKPAQEAFIHPLLTKPGARDASKPCQGVSGDKPRDPAALHYHSGQ